MADSARGGKTEGGGKSRKGKPRKEGRQGRGGGKAESRKSGKAGLSAEPEERSTLRLFDLPGRERGPGR